MEDIDLPSVDQIIARTVVSMIDVQGENSLFGTLPESGIRPDYIQSNYGAFPRPVLNHENSSTPTDAPKNRVRLIPRTTEYTDKDDLIDLEYDPRSAADYGGQEPSLADGDPLGWNTSEEAYHNLIDNMLPSNQIRVNDLVESIQKKQSSKKLLSVEDHPSLRVIPCSSQYLFTNHKQILEDGNIIYFQTGNIEIVYYKSGARILQLKSPIYKQYIKIKKAINLVLQHLKGNVLFLVLKGAPNSYRYLEQRLLN